MPAYKKFSSVSVPNPPSPFEGPGFLTFSNARLLGAIVAIPYFLTYLFGLSWTMFFIALIVLAAPIAGLYIVLDSFIATPPPGYNITVKLPGRPVESYLSIRDPTLAAKYQGHNKIPMEVFFENYFDGKIDLKGDCLEIFEARHDWARFCIWYGQAKFFVTQWIPELLWHSKRQDETQVRDHYDRGNDFYAAFLGNPMVYTSGIISDNSKYESIDQLQDNKMKLVCEKIHLKAGEKHLDIGCGWGTLVCYAAKHFGSHSTGVTIARNQVDFASGRAKEWGVENTAKFVCSDYRDIPQAPKYDKITCLEMAEHVGIRRFQTFIIQVRELLEDDGLFYLQIAGLRAAWQYEDFVWGLFMAKYIFPGADASCPLYWVIKQLETAGFEIHNVDTIGVHYSATIERWYKLWLENREKILKTYGRRWFRIWEIFLAWSTIVARQGSSTAFQIVAHKNRNNFDRSSLITGRLSA